MCGSVNGGCEWEAFLDHQADNARRAPAPLGSRPPISRGRAVRGNDDRDGGNDDFWRT